MTEDRFLDCLDLWGSDLSGWPAADQAAAQVLLARSALARDALARDRMLDRLLNASDPAVALDDGALDRVKAGVFAALQAEATFRGANLGGASIGATRPAPTGRGLSRAIGWAERIRGWFDLPGPVAPWGLRLASVILVAALLGSLTARSINLTTPSGTALEQIAMATPYTPLDVQ